MQLQNISNATVCMKFCNTFYIVNKSEIKKSTNENVTKKFHHYVSI